MKVSNIIADIEFIVPKGTLDKYKYGIEAPHANSIDSAEVIHQNPQIIEQDMNKLRSELSKSITNTAKLPEVTVVGKG